MRKSSSGSEPGVEYPWTIAALANEVGLSRSALVGRFTRYLAQPPMTCPPATGVNKESRQTPWLQRMGREAPGSDGALSG